MRIARSKLRFLVVVAVAAVASMLPSSAPAIDILVDVRIEAPNGIVRSTDGSVNCFAGANGRCLVKVKYGKLLTLRASPEPNFMFAGWRGTCVGAAPTCAFVAGPVTRIRALFRRTPTPVAITVSGPGAVTSVPPGISCGDRPRGDSCEASFGAGTSVTLRAFPAPDGQFVRWEGSVWWHRTRMSYRSRVAPRRDDGCIQSSTRPTTSSWPCRPRRRIHPERRTHEPGEGRGANVDRSRDGSIARRAERRHEQSRGDRLPHDVQRELRSRDRGEAPTRRGVRCVDQRVPRHGRLLPRPEPRRDCRREGGRSAGPATSRSGSQRVSIRSRHCHQSRHSLRWRDGDAVRLPGALPPALDGHTARNRGEGQPIRWLGRVLQREETSLHV